MILEWAPRTAPGRSFRLLSLFLVCLLAFDIPLAMARPARRTVKIALISWGPQPAFTHLYDALNKTKVFRALRSLRFREILTQVPKETAADKRKRAQAFIASAQALIAAGNKTGAATLLKKANELLAAARSDNPLADVAELQAMVLRTRGEKKLRFLSQLARRLDLDFILLAGPPMASLTLPLRLYSLSAKRLSSKKFTFSMGGPAAAHGKLARTLARYAKKFGPAYRTSTVGQKSIKRKSGRKQIGWWRKWWVWTILLGVGALTTGIILAARSNTEPSLNLRVVRWP